MNAKQKIHHAKLNQWIGLFKEQADSGLTVKQWCEQNNYSIHTYNYWKHILKEEYTATALPEIVPVLRNSYKRSPNVIIISPPNSNLLLLSISPQD